MSCCLCNREIQELLYTCGACDLGPNRFRLAGSLLFLLPMLICCCCCCSRCFHLIFLRLLLRLLLSLFQFDFVKCEIIIKIVGVYFVCSQLYKLHDLLGKRFRALTHTHTNTRLVFVRNVGVVTDDVRQMC